MRGLSGSGRDALDGKSRGKERERLKKQANIRVHRGGGGQRNFLFYHMAKKMCLLMSKSLFRNAGTQVLGHRDVKQSLR